MHEHLADVRERSDAVRVRRAKVALDALGGEDHAALEEQPIASGKRVDVQARARGEGVDQAARDQRVEIVASDGREAGAPAARRPACRRRGARGDARVAGPAADVQQEDGAFGGEVQLPAGPRAGRAVVQIRREGGDRLVEQGVGANGEAGRGQRVEERAASRGVEGGGDRDDRLAHASPQVLLRGPTEATEHGGGEVRRGVAATGDRHAGESAEQLLEPTDDAVGPEAELLASRLADDQPAPAGEVEQRRQALQGGARLVAFHRQHDRLTPRASFTGRPQATRDVVGAEIDPRYGEALAVTRATVRRSSAFLGQWGFARRGGRWCGVRPPSRGSPRVLCLRRSPDGTVFRGTGSPRRAGGR